MKLSKMTALGLFATSILSFNLNSQIKIKKPTIEITKPNLGGNNGGSSTSTINVGKDPSGLFSQVSDDPSAEHHRKTAVENLTKLETEYAKSSVDYEMLTKLMFENERTLGHIQKLEPNCKSEKYYDRYNPIKTRADKELAIYVEVEKLEKLFDNQYTAPTEYKNGFKDEATCYCRTYRDYKKTYAEYAASKAEYEKLTAQLVGYKNAETQQDFTNMETCLKNGNQFAVWASTENYQKEIVELNTKNKISDPKLIIKECDEYTAYLTKIETDASLNLNAEAKKSLTEGKANVAKVKAESETYINSGAFQKYLDKVHAEKIAKVFLPKAVTVNTKLEDGAKAYIKGAEFAEYLKGYSSKGGVASTVKAVTLTKEPYVKKNDYDLPLYQYHEIWVSYKGTDGKCYMTAVYASYTYKGGGTYATIPTWGADNPEEMSCLNVSK